MTLAMQGAWSRSFAQVWLGAYQQDSSFQLYGLLKGNTLLKPQALMAVRAKPLLANSPWMAAVPIE